MSTPCFQSSLARRWAAGALLGVMLCAIPSCVTEGPVSSRGRGVPVRPGRAEKSAPATRASAGKGAALVPPGPIAAPATGASTFVAAVSVSVRPIGIVPFDGQVLPLVSPDGRFLATETGEAPTWTTLLAQPGAEAPLRTGIGIYDISKSPPELVTPSPPLPLGLVLGRGADDHGFLVESPRPDGARWLGHVDWAGGRLRWLAQGTEVHAGAIVSADEAIIGGNGASYLFPLLGRAMRGVYAFELSKKGLEVVFLRMDPSAPGSLGNVVARRFISAEPDPFLAYQASSAVQATPFRGARASTGEAPDALLFHNPVTARMNLFDPETGTLTPLVERSIAGCWALDAAAPDATGVFVTTPRGLMFQRVMRVGAEWRVSPPTRVLGEAWVPRSTTNPDRPYILIGPVPSGGGGASKSETARLQIVAMKTVGPADAEGRK